MRKVKLYKCTKGFITTNGGCLKNDKGLLIEGGTEWYLRDEFINGHTVTLTSTENGEWVWVKIYREELEHHFKLLAQY